MRGNEPRQLRECGYVPVSLKNTRLTRPAHTRDANQEPYTARDLAEAFAAAMGGYLACGSLDPAAHHRRMPSLFSIEWEPGSDDAAGGPGEAQAMLIKCQCCGRKYLEVGWVESGWVATCPYCGADAEM
jgi:hypothetical protein